LPDVDPDVVPRPVPDPLPDFEPDVPPDFVPECVGAEPPARVRLELLAAVGGPGLAAKGSVAVIGGSAPVMLPTGMPLTGIPRR
jgi:hypothetical protein